MRLRTRSGIALLRARNPLAPQGSWRRESLDARDRALRRGRHAVPAASGRCGGAPRGRGRVARSLAQRRTRHAGGRRGVRPALPGAVGRCRTAARVRHPGGYRRGGARGHDRPAVRKGRGRGQARARPGERAYGLYPPWRGRGLATRAVLLASRYAAGEGAAEAVIRVEPGNPASAAVARRAGSALGRPRHGGEDGAPFDWYLRDLRNATPWQQTAAEQP
ncbi:GNAT family N-acetyltransferase [Streptacidiphilus monticola]